MNGNVRLELAERPHPYPSAPDSAGEVWGVIGFSCAGQRGMMHPQRYIPIRL